MNNRSDEYLSKIISKGGSAVGGLDLYASWSGLFSDQQIRDLIAHIRSLSRSLSHSSKGADR